MAISKTTRLVDLHIAYPVGGNAIMGGTILDTWDDPDDAELPVSKKRKFSADLNTDFSVYPQEVQDIAAVLYPDE